MRCQFSWLRIDHFLICRMCCVWVCVCVLLMRRTITSNNKDVFACSLLINLIFGHHCFPSNSVVYCIFFPSNSDYRWFQSSMHDICVKNKVGIFVILFFVLFLFYKISIRIEKQMPIRMNHQLMELFGLYDIWRGKSTI